MSIKTNFDNHPVVWGLSLVVTGFVAGFAVRAYVLPVPVMGINCTVEGLPSIEESRSKELATLNGQLVLLEAKASDSALINSYQEKYKEAADRIRNDIERSNKTYLVAVDSLRRKCK